MPVINSMYRVRYDYMQWCENMNVIHILNFWWLKKEHSWSKKTTLSDDLVNKVVNFSWAISMNLSRASIPCPRAP